MVYRLPSPLPLSAASTIVDAALAEGRSRNLLPLSVVVLDAGGHLIAMKREDGCGIVRTDVAIGKAWGSLGMGIPARTINERMSGNLGFLAGLISVSDGRMAPNAGGVLILDAQDMVLGAVGISGDTGDNDELCAIAAIRAAGFGSSPS